VRANAGKSLALDHGSTNPRNKGLRQARDRSE